VSSEEGLESTKKQLLQIAPTVQWNSLDVFQRQFCESFASNIRLLAPAGSGKTQSLLWRCAEVYRRQDEKARFLVVTFTRAARDELRARLSGKEFRGVADAIDVATLNAWGYRRVRAHHHSPRLLTTERDKNYCAQNALQPIWRAHAPIESAMKGQPYVVGPVLMNAIERLKTLGFRHPDADRRSFLANIRHLSELGLDHLLTECIQSLHQLGMLEHVTMEGLIGEFVPFWGPSVRDNDQTVAIHA
jgi:DNA helicase-2/ATP-dependent DNA helicase PcrA